MPQVSEFTEALDFRCFECDLERLFWFHSGFLNTRSQNDIELDETILDSGFFETEELLDVLGLFSREPPRAFINEFRLPFFVRDPSDF